MLKKNRHSSDLRFKIAVLTELGKVQLGNFGIDSSFSLYIQNSQFPNYKIPKSKNDTI
jgi:hypothetical protein